MKVKILYKESDLEIVAYSTGLFVKLSADGCVMIMRDVADDFYDMSTNTYNYHLERNEADTIIVVLN